MSEISLADKEKRAAALSSVFWALLLTVLKLAAGLATNSLGILSEALHSGLDLVAAAITYFAVRVAAKPADKTHHYGYGKVENLSALAETVLLLVTCTWIVREAVDRLFFSSVEVSPSLWGVGVIAISLIVDINRSRMLHRVAKKHNSQALEADAMHFTTDIWSSGVVLLGLLCVWGASYLPPDHWLAAVLHKSDAVAALFVSGIVVMVGLRLSRKAVSALLDGSGAEHTQALETALTQALPDFPVRRIRLRESGADVFVDVTVEVPASMPLESAHEVTRQVELVISSVLPTADVIVHAEPATLPEQDSILRTAHALATVHSLAIHNLSVNLQPSGTLVYLHVEAPPHITITDAHQRVDAFEQALGARLGAARVISHIEPEHRHPQIPVSPLDEAETARIMTVLQSILPDFPLISRVHELTACRLGSKPFLSFHCHVPGGISVEKAHALASALEDALHSREPELGHVLIHTDPDELSPHGDVR